jgi:asparagine synthetase B (glutamine-hydrolysing)
MSVRPPMDTRGHSSLFFSKPKRHMNKEPSTLLSGPSPKHQSLLAAVVRMFEDAVSRHQRVALLYSGGLESSLLLHLAEPWRDNVTVYNMRTGVEFLVGGLFERAPQFIEPPFK